MTPTLPCQRRDAFLPALPHRIEGVTACEEPIKGATLIIATDNEHSLVWQQCGSTACAPRRHRRARHPLSMPGVKHLDGTERAVALVPATHGVDHVWQRIVKAQKWRYLLGIKCRWKCSPPKVASLTSTLRPDTAAPLAVIKDECTQGRAGRPIHPLPVAKVLS